MRWYWWLLIGGALAIVAVCFIPWSKIVGSDNYDQLELARQAKAEKAKAEKESEKISIDADAQSNPV